MNPKCIKFIDVTSDIKMDINDIRPHVYDLTHVQNRLPKGFRIIYEKIHDVLYLLTNEQLLRLYQELLIINKINYESIYVYIRVILKLNQVKLDDKYIRKNGDMELTKAQLMAIVFWFSSYMPDCCLDIVIKEGTMDDKKSFVSALQSHAVIMNSEFYCEPHTAINKKTVVRPGDGEQLYKALSVNKHQYIYMAFIGILYRLYEHMQSDIQRVKCIVKVGCVEQDHRLDCRFDELLNKEGLYPDVTLCGLFECNNAKIKEMSCHQYLANRKFGGRGIVLDKWGLSEKEPNELFDLDANTADIFIKLLGSALQVSLHR